MIRFLAYLSRKRETKGSGQGKKKKTDLNQGGGGYNFLHIQENFRFEEKGKVPTNSQSIDMPQTLPMYFTPFSSVGPDLQIWFSRSRVQVRILRFCWKRRRWGKEQF